MSKVYTGYSSPVRSNPMFLYRLRDTLLSLCVFTLSRAAPEDISRGYREEINVRHRYFSAARCAPWDVASVLRFFRKRLARW